MKSYAGNILKWLASFFCCVSVVFGAVSCTRSEMSPVPDVCEGPVTVAFGIADASGTKTAVDGDGKGVSWIDGDKVRLWAYSSSGSETISGHPFTMLGHFGNEAIFTAEFANPMPEDTYTYYVCYPSPVSSDGNTLKFPLPANQDGKASGGADIMISGPVEGDALKPFGSGGSAFKMALKHMVHILKFYLPEGSTGLKGEGIRKIKVEMPGNVVGTMSVDRTDPSKAAVLTDGGSTVLLEMEEPLTPSYGGARNYAFASICPSSFSGSAKMKVTLYSDSWIGTVSPFSLAGRDFKAGHTTPVKLNVASVEPYYTLNLKLAGNNLGENIQKITVSADDSSLHLGDEGNSSYTFNPGRDISVGETITFSYMDENTYLALGGHTLTITYDSEHVRSSESFKVPSLASFRSYTYGMTVPYLLFEDFSGVGTFSSNDNYSSGFLSGSKDAYKFLVGWTGGRCGAQGGKCVRLACRRETSADYNARLDSAPLNGILKENARLKISFDYGADLEYTIIKAFGIEIDNGATGQTCYVGYTESDTAFKSGDDDGTYDTVSNIIYIGKSEKGGSYDNTPLHAEFILQNLPVGQETLRIAWKTVVEHRAGTHNCTNWLYIDNVKVVVVP